MSTSPIILWFRQDLRIRDNAALASAVRKAQPIVALFIFDEELEWAPGGASRWWLHHSLQHLRDTLAEKNARLILRRGPTLRILEEVVEESGAEAIYCSRQYEPTAIAMERKVHDVMQNKGVEVKRFSGYLLFEPESIQTQSGSPFKVYTPFWRACSQLELPHKSIPAPKSWLCFSQSKKLKSDKLSSWGLLPGKPNWAAGFTEFWQPGEAGAHKRLQHFLRKALGDYDHGRDIPAEDFTSRLSPHLHFGELSPRQIWHASNAKKNKENQEDIRRFLSELGWREFSHHLLFHWPDLPHKAFKRRYEDFPWANDEVSLRAWQQGQTGIPLIDAGMRQLWQSGWMHNRVRMIVASFLVKNLLIPWQEGEKWFWDTLVDANLANNAAGWQWVAGSGADAAPYFRIFNPVTQAQKFDPDGHYIRRWVPELAQLENRFLHEPWRAPVGKLEDAKVQLGKNYPYPIVDLKESRERALALNAQL